ncbi:MAG: phosphatase PAP2 family protein [Bacteroidetes Order II. Incertae sedis bacterium]|nr:phosphatase PAP2 family protein [Bacteroidetes Order II. bacterium]
MRNYLLLLLVCPLFAMAQSDWDHEALNKIYAHETPLFSKTMQVADRSSYPLFLLIPAGAMTAGAANIREYTLEQGWAVVASGVGSYAAMEALKRTFKRLRPYQTLPNIAYYRGEKTVPANDSYSMPSGHATLAFALATALTIQHQKWYVVVPAYLWAGSVGLSRVWNGVHYPSDILAGAVIGSGVAYLVHRNINRITPKSWRNDRVQYQMVPLGFSFHKNF